MNAAELAAMERRAVRFDVTTASKNMSAAISVVIAEDMKDESVFAMFDSEDLLEALWCDEHGYYYPPFVETEEPTDDPGTDPLSTAGAGNEVVPGKGG